MLLAITLLLSSCDNKTSNDAKINNNDSLDLGGRSELEIRDSLKKVVDKRLMESYSEEAVTTDAPIVVTKSRFVSDEYSRYKDVSLTFKNVSGKNVTAIRFKWVGKNAFDEPAEMNSHFAGTGGGFTDTPLKAGKTTTSVWDINSSDGKTITKAWAYEVMFADGTKWELK